MKEAETKAPIDANTERLCFIPRGLWDKLILTKNNGIISNIVVGELPIGLKNKDVFYVDPKALSINSKVFDTDLMHTTQYNIDFVLYNIRQSLKARFARFLNFDTAVILHTKHPTDQICVYGDHTRLSLIGCDSYGTGPDMKTIIEFSGRGESTGLPPTKIEYDKTGGKTNHDFIMDLTQIFKSKQ